MADKRLQAAGYRFQVAGSNLKLETCILKPEIVFFHYS